MSKKNVAEISGVASGGGLGWHCSPAQYLRGAW